MVKQTWSGLSRRQRWGAAALLAASLAHFAIGSYRAAASGFVDLHIFLNRAEAFTRDGVLYPNPDDVKTYEPGAVVYKFPPLFAVTLLPQVQDGIPDRVYLFHWIAHLVMYAVTVALLLSALGPGRSPWFVVLLLVVALNFVPFFETLWRLQLETPILLLCAAALWCQRRNRSFLAGAALGAATMLKIYPAFLLGWFVVRRCKRGLAGAAASMVALALVGWWVIGADQNMVYYTRILPRLLQEAARLTPENVSLVRPFEALLGLGPQLSKRLGQALSLIVLSLGYWFLQRRSGKLPGDLSLALFICCMLLFMPNVWTNYLLLLLLPLAVLLARLCEEADESVGARATTALCFFLTLFYTPCGPFEEGIPCTETPPFLGVFYLPRWLHDVMVNWKVLAVMLLAASWFFVVLRERRVPRSRV